MTKATSVLLTLLFCQGGAALLYAGAQAGECAPDALGTKRVLAIGPTEPVGFKTYPRSLALADKELILTFDDGPLPATTSKILDILKEECVKATFFIIGRNAAAHPAIVRRIAAEGHTIAHHSYSHPALTLRNMTLEKAMADIEAGVAADEKAAFGAAKHDGSVKFFRFPGFADSQALNEKLSAQNIVVFGADLWSSDWRPMSAQAQYEFVMKRIEASGKGVVLMHDIKKQTADSLRPLLRTLKDRGYSIVHIKPGETAPALESAPQGWTSETERTFNSMRPKASPAKNTKSVKMAGSKMAGGESEDQPQSQADEN